MLCGITASSMKQTSLERSKLRPHASSQDTNLVSLDALYTETGWETLESRRNKYKLTLFYKMKSGKSPHYLTTLIPPIDGNTSTYNLRNAHDIGIVHANPQLYYNSFLPSVIRKWNELPEDTRQSSNIASCKTHLNRDRIVPPSYYYAGTRDGQIYHTRLRTSCSNLNQSIIFILKI